MDITIHLGPGDIGTILGPDHDRALELVRSYVRSAQADHGGHHHHKHHQPKHYQHHRAPDDHDGTTGRVVPVRHGPRCTDNYCACHTPRTQHRVDL